MKSDPAQLTLTQKISALKSENGKLQRKIAKLEVEKFSFQSEVAALKKQLKHMGAPDLGEALRRARERVRGVQ